MQLILPTIPAPPDRPRRRALWRAEVRRLAQLLDDQRARDRASHEADIARLTAALSDARSRLTHIEHSTGMADLSLAPVRRDALVRFAR
jgi:hypothetical protein